MPIFFIGHIILRIIYGKVKEFGGMRLLDNLIEIFIIISSTLKVLQFIRYKEEFGFFVLMFFSVIKELLPFLFMFALFIVVFTLFQIILGV